MCPENEMDEKSSENGLAGSLGPTGELSPSGQLGARLVRHHKGVSDILVGSLLIENLVPATFSALKVEDLEGYTVTLSFGLTSTRYAELISRLETSAGMLGENVSVGVKFEPMTPNLVPPDTVQSI